ncbi:V-type ATP synthase subunit D [Rubritalea spongiae]|uniref:V-type ATP synthase subunit D n=1 Tax=Rubritalea spongiae TaxID=430797 RepID=A0ABW5E4B3_9BACT
MGKAVLSKSGLQRERESLKLYHKVLPSLDLKRQQLLGEQKKAEREYRALQEEFAPMASRLAEQLPMLAKPSVDLTQFIQITDLVQSVENIVGVKVPLLERLEFEVKDYAFLGTPQWVDAALDGLKDFAELKVRAQVGKERLEILTKAARKITQRVNLFEKVLIPEAEENIKKIQIYLADAERSAVVQSKLAKAKAKKRAEAEALKGGGV